MARIGLFVAPIGLIPKLSQFRVHRSDGPRLECDTWFLRRLLDPIASFGLTACELGYSLRSSSQIAGGACHSVGTASRIRLEIERWKRTRNMLVKLLLKLFE